jgi:hypothetical protein
MCDLFLVIFFPGVSGQKLQCNFGVWHWFLTIIRYPSNTRYTYEFLGLPRDAPISAVTATALSKCSGVQFDEFGGIFNLSKNNLVN